MGMKIDDAGIKLITTFEGLRLKAYQDSTGKWTIGYGHTATAKPGMVITKDQAIALLKRDVVAKEDCVSSRLTRAVSQGQFNALVSLAFNMGCNAKGVKRLIGLANAGQDVQAAAAFKEYVKADGKTLTGLVRRRESESKMYASAKAPGNVLPGGLALVTNKKSPLVQAVISGLTGYIPTTYAGERRRTA